MSRRGENIYKRKDGRWEARLIIGRNSDNKIKYKYLYAKSYREAKEKLLKARVAYQDSQKTESVSNEDIKTDTLENMAEKWFLYKSANVKLSTVNKYRIALDHYIIPYIGDLTICSLSKKNVEDFVMKLLTGGKRAGEGLAPKTVADTLSILTGILDYASEHGCNVDHKICKVKVRKDTSISSPPTFSIEEQKLLVTYLSENMNHRNLGIMLSLFSGLRIGELCALRWENISLNKKNIYVCQTMQRLTARYDVSSEIPCEDDGISNEYKTYISISAPKSICSIRTIPIPDQMVAFLAPFEQQSGYLLTGSEEKYIEPRSMQYYFKKVLRQCQLEETHFHTCRHTFATRCVELGFDVKSLSEILGHASVNITMNRYVHPSMELKRDNMNRLNTLIEQNKPSE